MRVGMPLAARSARRSARRPAATCCSSAGVADGDARGLGRVRGDGRAAATRRSTSTARPHVIAASSCPRLLRAGDLARRRRRRRCSRRSRATRWPRRRWRWPCSTPSCAPPARSFAEHLGAVRDRVPAGVSVGIMDTVAELLDAVAGYLDDGYLRIKLKIEPGWDVEPVAAVRERFGDDAAAAGRRQHRLHARRRRATSPSSTPSTCCSSSSRSPRTTCAATPQLARRIAHADLPRRVDLVGPGRRRRDRASAPARSSTSSRAGSAATSRPARPRRVPGARRPGVVRRDARDRASAAPPTWRSPRCPGSRCPATRRRRTATTPRPHRAVRARATATSPCRPARASASTRIPDVLAEVTTSSTWLPAGGAHGGDTPTSPCSISTARCRSPSPASSARW